MTVKFLLSMICKGVEVKLRCVELATYHFRNNEFNAKNFGDFKIRDFRFNGDVLEIDAVTE